MISYAIIFPMNRERTRRNQKHEVLKVIMHEGNVVHCFSSRDISSRILICHSTSGKYSVNLNIESTLKKI